MLTTLQTAYTDTRAADLAWALGREPLPALAVLDLQLGDAQLQLRLLGASHQVLLEEERRQLFRDGRLHAGQQHAAAARRRQTARATGTTNSRPASRRSPQAPSRGARRSCSRWWPTIRTGLAGTFPGSPHAFTAMLAQRTEDQVRWRTWHAYPQEGQLVATRTRVGGADAGSGCTDAPQLRLCTQHLHPCG